MRKRQKVADLAVMAEVTEHALHISAQHLANIPLSTAGGGGDPLLGGRGAVSTRGLQASGQAVVQACCSQKQLGEQKPALQVSRWGVGQLGALRLSAHGGGVTPRFSRVMLTQASGWKLAVIAIGTVHSGACRAQS